MRRCILLLGRKKIIIIEGNERMANPPYKRRGIKKRDDVVKLGIRHSHFLIFQRSLLLAFFSGFKRFFSVRPSVVKLFSSFFGVILIGLGTLYLKHWIYSEQRKNFRSYVRETSEVSCVCGILSAEQRGSHPVKVMTPRSHEMSMAN